MSAFLLGDNHLNAILNFYSDSRGEDPATDKHLQIWGDKLRQQNMASVNYRYEEKISTPSFTFKRCPSEISAVQALKLCECYEYQTEDAPDYNTSEAKFILKAIMKSALHSLPGYDKAEWSLVDEWSLD